MISGVITSEFFSFQIPKTQVLGQVKMVIDHHDLTCLIDRIPVTTIGMARVTVVVPTPPILCTIPDFPAIQYTTISPTAIPSFTQPCNTCVLL